MKRFIIFGLVLSTMIFGNVLKAQYRTPNYKSMEPNETTKKYSTLLYLINNFYVDTLDMPGLVEKAIVATLKDLDPHSAYIPKKEVERTEEPLKGSFEGIGITFQLYHDTILVIAPIPGGPSDKVGIMAGDKIIKVDGEDAFGEKITNKWVMDHLRGKKGTKVNVAIYRKGVKGLLDFTIIRDKIPLNSLDAAFMLDKNTGYIKLNRFAKQSKDEFDKAFDSLKRLGLKNLVFDLRGNSGGYLGTAMQIADEFLPDGKLIVYTQGIHSPRQDLNATAEGNFEHGKLIVLINEGSASASEIVSGAMKDWDRAILIGRRTFGKGLVQRPFRLPDGSVVRLTTARYYTPSGRCIQKPYDKGVDEYYKDFAERMKHGELIHPDSIHFPDSLKYKTAHGRTVYGGGGIMPDIFIPWDSTRYSELYSQLIRKGVFNAFVNDFLDNNRKKLLKKYKTFDNFNKSFVIDDAEYNMFLEKAQDKLKDFDKEKLNGESDFIKMQLKALLARNLYNQNAYYQTVSTMDDAIQKALQVLKTDEYFKKLKIEY
jgi:carboxyl-terminal processing protease